MMTTQTFRALALWAALLASPVLRGEIADEARSIFERYVEAIGGREKIESIETIRLEGSMQMPAMGIDASMTAIMRAPNLAYIEQTIPGMGVIKQGFDGETGWTDIPMQGFRQLSPEEVEQLKSEYNIRSDIEFEDKYASASVTGQDTVEDDPVTVIKAIRRRDNSEETHYYSNETGLLRRMDLENDMGPQGKIPAEVIVHSYIETDGIKSQGKIEIKNPALNMVLEFTKMEINQPIDDSLFSPPEAAVR